MMETDNVREPVNVIQANSMRLVGWQPSWDLPLTMYYDETNNIRRLRLSEVGLNVPADKVFVLAGIALKPGSELQGWAELRKTLRIQDSADELKFKHIAPSDYEGALASPKLAAFLKWLLASDVLLHYSLLDVLYWSILDIIESLQVDPRVTINDIHRLLKNELYFAVSVNPSRFMTLLHNFGYPDLQRADVRSFLTCVLSFIERQVPKNRSDTTRVLKQVLRKVSKLKGLELDFLHDEDKGELIKDFATHFMHVLCVFKNANHVLDEETEIQKRLLRMELRDGDRRLHYRFADSVDEIGIQASDVVTGLLGRHFTYVLQHTMPELRAAKTRFTAQQHETLVLLRELLNRSADFSDGLLHAVVPDDTLHKNSEFVYGVRAPAYLG